MNVTSNLYQQAVYVDLGFHWMHLKQLIVDRWNMIPCDEVEHIAGRRERLIKTLQRHYKLLRHQAETSIDEFLGDIIPDRDFIARRFAEPTIL
jgi:hypothetical protein